MLVLMVDTELGIVSSPDLIGEIRVAEGEISRIRARQVRLLRELMRRSPLSKPDPSPSGIAAELDVSTETAGALLETARRSPELSERMRRLEAGEWSFDRATAVARLFAAGADDETMMAADSRDIGGIDKLRAMTRRIRRRDERQAHEERYLRCTPSLDESVGFIHAQRVSHVASPAQNIAGPRRSWQRGRPTATLAVASQLLSWAEPSRPRGTPGAPSSCVLAANAPASF